VEPVRIPYLEAMMTHRMQCILCLVVAWSCYGSVSEPTRPSPLTLYVPQMVPGSQKVVPSVSQEPQLPTMQTMPEVPRAQMPQMAAPNAPQTMPWDMPQMVEVPVAVVPDGSQPIAEEPASALAFLGGLAGGLAAGAALVYSLLKSVGQKMSVEAQKLELGALDVESASVAPAGVAMRRTPDPLMQLNSIGAFGQQPTPLSSPWSIKEVSRNGALMQRVEGTTRKTWKFNDLTKDRVQVALASEGRPINSDVQVWWGPNYTPFKMSAYSEDGRLRPIQAIVGTRNKAAMIEVRNVGDSQFPFNAASDYAEPPMAALPVEIPASTPGVRVDGGAIRSFTIEPGTEQVEVVLKTEGKQLNAKIEMLNAPNNPKQVYECFTNKGELDSVVMAFNTPDAGNTIRFINLAPVEFPCYIHIRQKP